jgi:hypothetical protein
VIDAASDLAGIFASDDFAKSFTRVRTAVANVEIRAIIGAIDDEVLEGRSIAAIRKALYPAGTDVRADDKLVALVDIDVTMPAGTVLKVLEKPKRVNDGLEVEALLGSATL